MNRVLPLVAMLALAGCGGSGNGSSASKPVNPNAKEVSPAGDIPDNQVFVRYSPPGGAYSVKVPEGWSRTAAGSATTFTDNLNSISMRSAAGARLSPAAAKSAEVPRLARTFQSLRDPKVSTLTRAGDPVTRITFLAKGKPDPVTGKSRVNAVEEYVYARAGHRLYLTLSGPKAADNVDPWKLVSDS